MHRFGYLYTRPIFVTRPRHRKCILMHSLSCDKAGALKCPSFIPIRYAFLMKGCFRNCSPWTRVLVFARILRIIDSPNWNPIGSAGWSTCAQNWMKISIKNKPATAFVYPDLLMGKRQVTDEQRSHILSSLVMLVDFDFQRRWMITIPLITARPKVKGNWREIEEEEKEEEGREEQFLMTISICRLLS